ncbi:hypothetical protein SSX86_005516 [Deinandra increscens subsp. villosa]|uniref:BHLH domain-containing protein n=1 Tax=Deinandra increscens subsp. villosa TaxID=3103831 RepID=A0AAP0DQ14_9ASTR
MAEGVSQEKFFWDTHPWVMSGSEDKSSGDKNLCDLSTRENHNPMKQLPDETKDLDGSSRGDREVVTTGDGSSKKNDDAFEVKKEIKAEDAEVEASLRKDKAKRELVPTDHEMHIWTERERRKKMRDMFHQLHGLMPHLPQKADKSAVVDEAVRYIKTLQQTLQRLETKKLERLYGPSPKTTTTSPVQPRGPSSINTRESFIADQGSSTGIIGKISPSSSTSSFPLCSPKVFQTWVSSNVTLNVCGRDALMSICSFRKHGMLTAICFVLKKHKLEIVSAQISSDESKSLFMIHAQANACDQFMETFHYDKIYKQAASEITHWLNSKSS